MSVAAPYLDGLPADAPGGRRQVTRIIPADLDAVELFETLVPGADTEALLAIVAITSPELADLIGELGRVPAHDRTYGAGAGWVMPAFTRRYVRPSRFTDGGYGVWYVAWTPETAIAETLHHAARRLRETGEPAQRIVLQVLTADVAGFAAVLSQLGPPLGPSIHDPDGYAVSQIVGRHLRDRGSDAIVYRSTRDPAGTCTAILHPRAVRYCRRAGAVDYAWDGAKLTAGAIRPIQRA